MLRPIHNACNILHGCCSVVRSYPVNYRSCNILHERLFRRLSLSRHSQVVRYFARHIKNVSRLTNFCKEDFRCFAFACLYELSCVQYFARMFFSLSLSTSLAGCAIFCTDDCFAVSPCPVIHKSCNILHGWFFSLPLFASLVNRAIFCTDDSFADCSVLLVVRAIFARHIKNVSRLTNFFARKIFFVSFRPKDKSCNILHEPVICSCLVIHKSCNILHGRLFRRLSLSRHSQVVQYLHGIRKTLAG